MAAEFFTVVVPATATSLQTLFNALPGAPTMSTLGIVRPGPSIRFAQLLLQSQASNAANISGGGATVTAANPAWTLVPGGSYNLGNGTAPIGALHQIYVIGNGTDKLGVTVVN